MVGRRQLTISVVELSESLLIRRVRDNSWTRRLPTSSLAQVAALFDPDVLLESKRSRSS